MTNCQLLALALFGNSLAALRPLFGHFRSLLTSAALSTSASSAANSSAPIDFERAKADIVRNIRAQYRVLRNLTDDFREVFARESRQAQGLYKNLTKSLAWYLAEPDEAETQRLDAMLGPLFPFGGRDQDFVDSSAAMDEYCLRLEERLDALKSWLRRKFRYHMLVQVALNMLVARVQQKNEYFCNATAHRLDFVRHMARARAVNPQLVEAKEQLLDAALFIQRSEYQLPKVGRLCW